MGRGGGGNGLWHSPFPNRKIETVLNFKPRERNEDEAEHIRECYSLYDTNILDKK